MRRFIPAGLDEHRHEHDIDADERSEVDRAEHLIIFAGRLRNQY
jgi:hypothetical protein